MSHSRVLSEPLFRNSEGKIVPAPWGYPGNDEFRAPVVQRRKVISMDLYEARMGSGKWTFTNGEWSSSRTLAQRRETLRLRAEKAEEARILAELNREDERA